MTSGGRESTSTRRPWLTAAPSPSPPASVFCPSSDELGSTSTATSIRGPDSIVTSLGLMMSSSPSSLLSAKSRIGAPVAGKTLVEEDPLLLCLAFLAFFVFLVSRISLARLKSRIFTSPTSSSTITFASLMSRWSTPWRCALARPRASSIAIRWACCQEIGRSSSPRLLPRMYSQTRYGLPSISPTRYIAMMFG